ncbi:hypothetical protein MSUIS_05590 [Mycoplasma suis KI3806]|uniref:Uncharacterized protein n=1 Tax=Mycoplasma suis (strain KI_3806) TaxID=708248 RepID=F0V1X1_MYCS3|nr:hypothetical protein [Mycoplasma suis]CBZ40652.1 hypothetical protein MSUIS_05590 [Mycoplasma suis KI3806]
MTIFLKGLLTLGLLVGSGGVVTGSYFFKEQLGLGNKRIGENSNSGVEAETVIQDASKGDSDRNRNSNEHAAEKSSKGKEQQENSSGGNSGSGSISSTDISRESLSSISGSPVTSKQS